MPKFCISMFIVIIENTLNNVTDVFRADGSKLQKGDRVLSGDDFGTVLYIGCVPPSDGKYFFVMVY